MQKEEQRFCNLGRIDGETTILNRLERTGKKNFTIPIQIGTFPS